MLQKTIRNEIAEMENTVYYNKEYIKPHNHYKTRPPYALEHISMACLKHL